MKISETGVAITNRFFEALAMLKEQKTIGGIQTFTTENDINKRNFYVVKKGPENHVLKPEWISYLVKDYGISSEWILTGKGGMLSKKNNAIHKKKL